MYSNVLPPLLSLCKNRLWISRQYVVDVDVDQLFGRSDDKWFCYERKSSLAFESLDLNRNVRHPIIV